MAVGGRLMQQTKAFHNYDPFKTTSLILIRINIFNIKPPVFKSFELTTFEVPAVTIKHLHNIQRGSKKLATIVSITLSCFSAFQCFFLLQRCSIPAGVNTWLNNSVWVTVQVFWGFPAKTAVLQPLTPFALWGHCSETLLSIVWCSAHQQNL